LQGSGGSSGDKSLFIFRRTRHQLVKGKAAEIIHQRGIGRMLIKSAEIVFIPEKAKLNGKLETPGTLTIFGSFEGSIKSSILEIIKNGKAFAAVEAESVTIAGYFEGEIACYGHLTIAKTATVKGRVAYGSLSVETGALLDGEVFQLESKDTKLIFFHPQKAKSKSHKNNYSKK